MKNIIKLTNRIGRRLNADITSLIDQSPFATRDFAWKVRLRMKYDRNPILVTVQDKYDVKEFAFKQGVKTAQTYYVTRNPETIPFSKLPDKYFIKATHGCGWNIYCTNGEFFLRKNGENVSLKESTGILTTQSECIKICDEWLKTVYSRREWAYDKIVPKIIVEEALKAPGDEELLEYKLYVFNGNVKAINVRSSSYRRNHQNIFFSPEWKEYKLKMYIEKRPDVLPKKPDNLEEMLDIGQKLGRDLDFIRIDLYNTDHGVLLGEMTVYPYGGGINTPTADPEFNKWLGEQWTLPFHTSLFF